MLFAELDLLFRETRSFSYKNPAIFGKRVKDNLPALRILGFDFVDTRGGHDYIFRPAVEELAYCQQLHQDFLKTSGTNALSVLYGMRRTVDSGFDPDDMGPKASIQ
jgi:hypothetical protein